MLSDSKRKIKVRKENSSTIHRDKGRDRKGKKKKERRSEREGKNKENIARERRREKGRERERSYMRRKHLYVLLRTLKGNNIIPISSATLVFWATRYKEKYIPINIRMMVTKTFTVSSTHESLVLTGQVN